MAVLATLFVSGGCGNSSSGGGEILATVAGEPITMDEFNKYLAIKPTARVIVQGQMVELPVADTLAFQAMQDMVSRMAVFQMAKDEGVSPTEKDVEDEIAFQKKLNPTFLTGYQRRGLTMGQIREEVKFSLVQERLITKGITVTPEEVDDWLAKNPEAGVMPESAELSWILASTPERKAQVDTALKNGEKFSAVAVKLSQAPNAAIVNGRYLPDRGPIPIPKMTCRAWKPVIVK